MSMRDREQRKRRATSRADAVEKRMIGRMREAELLAKEVKRRVEVGDVEPRPLPSVRESVESSLSMGSSGSMASARLSGGVPAEEDAYSGGNMGGACPWS